MRGIGIIVSIVLGVAAGLGLSAFVIRQGIALDVQRLGIWDFAPRAGSPEMDPYRRARQFADGELPLAAGEGFSLLARKDDGGRALSGSCRYRLDGPLPAARFWTLTLTSPEGLSLANPAGRSGFTSGEILRDQDGRFSIMIGASPLAGNWLPSTPGRTFVLTLRFYEPPLSATATILDPQTLPVLTRTGCAS